MRRSVWAVLLVLGLAGQAVAEGDHETEAFQAGAFAEQDPPEVVEKEASPLAEMQEEEVEMVTASAEKARPAAVASRRQPPKGLAGPGNLRINGKFDIAYERHGYTDKVWDGSSRLRNHHRFIFLSRESRDDPFFFTAELIDQWFYEFGARWHTRGSPWHFMVRTGKVLVPFGGEPLFHDHYGGLSGSDQPVLPLVWAQHGAVGQVRYRSEHGFTLSNDLYAIQGYALAEEDAVLNLRRDFAPDSDVKGGFGNRLGFGMGPFSVWYSALYNPLGFDRRLFMQAMDAVLWRIADVPVLEDVAVRTGMMRADVSGGREGFGGAGDDYFHYANYLDLRYYPLDWLWIQARTGIRTFDNRRGHYMDDDRLTNRDGTSHNIGVVYENAGWMVALHHYWNLEKVNEIENDFLRLRVGYEF